MMAVHQREPRFQDPVRKPSTAYLRTGTRFKPDHAASEYDAIIIGSGPAGLASAVCLSKMGWKVVVLEQHYTAGGFTHAYGRFGYEWDVGVHYIGDMGSDHTLGKRTFDFLTAGKLKWASMGEVYDRAMIGTEVFDFPQGRDQLKKALKDRFPEEVVAIDRYFELVRCASSGMSLYTLSKLTPDWFNQVWLNKKIPELLFRNTREVLEELTQNQKLIAVLTTQWGDAGLPPGQSSFLIHAIIAKHYFYGGFYPEGGASEIARHQITQIEAAGGKVFTYATVDEICVSGNRVSGVRLKNGTELNSSVVISAVGVPLTYEKLLPESVSSALGWIQKKQQIRPSMSHLCVYIGLQESAAALRLPKCNFWIYPDEFSDQNVARFTEDPQNDFPLVYVSFPSAKDPTWDERYPDTATIEIVAPAAYEWFQKWEGSTWNRRGDDYEVFKTQMGERLLEILYQKLPQLRDKIDYWEVSTPLSTQHFNAYQHGEIYGLDHNPKRFRQKWLKPETGLKGLYLSGQDILTCGVVGGMMTGMMTSVAVLGWFNSWKLFRLMKRELKKLRR